MRPGRIHIGTSGWHYTHWAGPFYPLTLPTDEYLPYYTRYFHTVEINNTFYHLPSRQTLMTWRDHTPKHFVFAVKGSRFITHMKKLKDPEISLQKFFDAIQALGNKLGPILFQLPPGWNVNLQRLECFLNALPESYRYAFEFRDQSWLASDTYAVLKNHHAALCLYHLDGRWTPMEVTADFVYIRLHGPGEAYKGRYAERALQDLAARCVTWVNEGKDVYCYFDNDEQAYAAKDATRLKVLVA